jgi:phosphoglycerate dehydrogenase-like enzyme
MKARAILINLARAELVDEGALYKALTDRSIARAALDVWYRYPRVAGAAPSLHEWRLVADL